MLKISIWLTLLLVGLAACSPATPTAAPAPVDAPVNDPAPTLAETPVVEADSESAVEAGASASTSPAWLSLPLTDARTGETFTLADFAGKTVYVEPMATWCTNCRRQQQTVREVIPQLDSDEYIFLSLSVETTISDDDLAQYAQREDFGWNFAIATPELLTELTNAYGRAITTPPSTPHFIIRPDGSVTDLATGQHSADELTQQLTAASGA